MRYKFLLLNYLMFGRIMSWKVFVTRQILDKSFCNLINQKHEFSYPAQISFSPLPGIENDHSFSRYSLIDFEGKSLVVYVSYKKIVKMLTKNQIRNI